MATTNYRILRQEEISEDFWVGWTTVDSREIAERIARDTIQGQLAVCAQVDGPITSFYQWEGNLERSREYRITFKLLPRHRHRLREWLREHHPYDTAQWIAVRAADCSPEYLRWAIQTQEQPRSDTPAPS